jgi:hypothetical protein
VKKLVIDEIVQALNLTTTETLALLEKKKTLLKHCLIPTEDGSILLEERGIAMLQMSADEQCLVLEARIASLDRLVAMKQEMINQVTLESINRERFLQDQVFTLRSELSELQHRFDPVGGAIETMRKDLSLQRVRETLKTGSN